MSLDHFDTGDRQIHPVVTLKNGLRVANFSSPHPFTFTDGTVLPACSDETCRAGTLNSIEIATERIVKDVATTDVQLTFELSDTAKVMLSFIVDRADIDIVLVPLPLMESVKKLGLMDYNKLRWRAEKKIRCVRMADRIKKIIFSDKFCI